MVCPLLPRPWSAALRCRRAEDGRGVTAGRRKGRGHRLFLETQGLCGSPPFSSLTANRASRRTCKDRECAGSRWEPVSAPHRLRVRCTLRKVPQVLQGWGGGSRQQGRPCGAAPSLRPAVPSAACRGSGWTTRQVAQSRATRAPHTWPIPQQAAPAETQVSRCAGPCAHPQTAGGVCARLPFPSPWSSEGSPHFPHCVSFCP